MIVEPINCEVEAFWLGGTEVNGTIYNENGETGFAQWDQYFNYENPEPNDTQGMAASKNYYYVGVASMLVIDVGDQMCW